ncbi:GPI mannosyltransferase 4 [Scheffersomyces amazonensis]|uniref:GPI mannosyltransferase 4 n=1 Tax=Scheffersomyces amazonensis TaxID=1078765 RepID=UPI00315CB86F
MAIPSLNWRYLLFVSIGLRFIFALSNSYIHPDEHFQSLQVLTNRVLNFSTSIPWEFSSSAPARSLGPLYLLYGPLLYFIKFSGVSLTPLQIWYLARLQNVIIGWLITDFCLYRILPTKPERVKAIFFTSTSYITLVYQSHLFSNSIETYLVLVSVLIIDDLRSALESNDQESYHSKLFWLGTIISIGLFNRVTFPVFIIIPLWFVFRYIWTHKLSIVFIIIGFAIPTAIFILIDTFCFTSLSLSFDNFDLSQLVITPLNNLIYNSSYDNLSHHGIHPFYNHIAVNLPQVVGPSGLLFLFTSRQYWKTTPFLSLIGGILFLSLIPHQELRFLIPILPLACSCFNLYAFIDKDQHKSNWKSSILINGWYLFNIILTILMGVYHQGGVIPALDYFYSESDTTEYVQIWWRTYSPPTWFLGDTDSQLQCITLNDDNFSQGYQLDSTKSKFVIDTMGIDYDKLLELIKSIQKEMSTSSNAKPIYLITPSASFNTVHLSNDNQYQLIWNYDYHLDLDHLDFHNIESLKPGLGVYQLI